MIFSGTWQGFVDRGLGDTRSQNILTPLLSCFEALLRRSKDTGPGSDKSVGCIAWLWMDPGHMPCYATLALNYTDLWLHIVEYTYSMSAFICSAICACITLNYIVWTDCCCMVNRVGWHHVKPVSKKTDCTIHETSIMSKDFLENSQNYKKLILHISDARQMALKRYFHWQYQGGMKSEFSKRLWKTTRDYLEILFRNFVRLPCPLGLASAQWNACLHADQSFSGENIGPLQERILVQ